MNRKIKKIIGVFLSAAMVFTTFAALPEDSVNVGTNIQTSANSYSGQYGNFLYRNIDHWNVEIVYYSGSDSDITIPSKIGEADVIAIARDSFSSCTTVKRVTIPNSITKICDGAFTDCENLESISIPNSVTIIKQGAFGGCPKLNNVVLPTGLTEIEAGLFGGCKSLSSITIPNSVKIIGKAAFCKCTSLKSVILPDGLTIIGESAFNGCDNLLQIDIPETVTTIYELAFNSYGFLDNLAAVIIPKSVTYIGNSAFTPWCTIMGYKGTAAEQYAKEYSLHEFVDCEKLTCEHSYTSKITKAATCTTAGVKTFTCSKWREYPFFQSEALRTAAPFYLSSGIPHFEQRSAVTGFSFVQLTQRIYGALDLS